MKARFFFVWVAVLILLSPALLPDAPAFRFRGGEASVRRGGEAPTGGELLFSELMVDPTPSLGVLPQAEYIELFNAGDRSLRLEGVAVASGGAPRLLGDYTLPPGQYVLLCAAEAAAPLAAFGPVIALERFPTLTNAGDEVLLLGSEGDTLDWLRYGADWYGTAEKADGGWALERRSAVFPSGCRHNWSAALDPQGGTPGAPNSVAPPDGRPPTLLRAATESAEEVRLFFDRQLEARRAADPAAYQLTPNPGIAAALPQPPAFQEVLLLLASPLMADRRYTARATPQLRDCLGEAATADAAVRLGLPSPIAAGDLLINELLFRPQTGGYDFVELYNASDKTLDLQDLQLINVEKSGQARLATVAAPLQLFPGEYVVFTESPEDIRQRYAVLRPEALLQNALPALDAERGNLTLRRQGRTFDSLDYRDDWHSPLLDDTRGVSLERLSARAPTQAAGNWHSAAATAGFATPTAPNSQRRAAASTGDGFFQLPVQTFSPDGDGFQDVLLIDYRADQPGYTLNLRVFDAAGRPVRTLVDNELLGTEGILQWDGTDGQGKKARLGIYILWFELFHPDGTVRREKKTCVLAGRL